MRKVDMATEIPVEFFISVVKPDNFDEAKLVMTQAYEKDDEAPFNMTLTLKVTDEGNFFMERAIEADEPEYYFCLAPDLLRDTLAVLEVDIPEITGEITCDSCSGCLGCSIPEMEIRVEENENAKED